MSRVPHGFSRPGRAEYIRCVGRRTVLVGSAEPTKTVSRSTHEFSRHGRADDARELADELKCLESDRPGRLKTHGGALAR